MPHTLNINCYSRDQCSVGEAEYCRLAVQSSWRRISTVLSRTYRSRHNHYWRWTSNVNQRRDYRRYAYGPALRRRDLSGAFTAKGRTKVQVVWELSVKKIDDHTCEYNNHIHPSARNEFYRIHREEWRHLWTPCLHCFQSNSLQYVLSSRKRLLILWTEYGTKMSFHKPYRQIYSITWNYVSRSSRLRVWKGNVEAYTGSCKEGEPSSTYFRVRGFISSLKITRPGISSLMVIVVPR